MAEQPHLVPLPYAVRETGLQLRRLLDALPLGLALLDHKGDLLTCNDAFALSVGCECPAGLPLPHEMTVAADRPSLTDGVKRALYGAHLPIELRLRKLARSDEPLVLTIAAAPPGLAATLLVAVRDVREQLRLERQVAQATKMQAIGQLAGGVAHDFNNILTANLGLVEQLIERHQLGDDDFDDLEQVRLNNARGAELVRQLLAFARQQTLRPQLIDVGAVIEALATLLRRLLGTAVTLELDLRTESWPVRVDPGQLEQVIVNLAVNARDAMPAGGTLRITTRAILAADVPALGYSVMPASDFLEIAVSDSGTGIPKELGAKIFEPFFTTKEAGKGTGLGLSTVYGIVKQTGGFVFNDTAALGGTVFSLYFPRADGILETPPAESRSAEASPVTRRAADVLLVEDDRSVRLVLNRALLKAGFKVAEAVDALAALPIIEDPERVIDVLVTDVMMPGMDGTELVRRARLCRPDLPVVLMSGYAEPPQRERASDPGTAFLAKPFAAAALLAAVDQALASTLA